MKWISVEDRVPEIAQDILVYNRSKNNIHRGIFVSAYYPDLGTGFTHWIPLPKAPEPKINPCPFCGLTPAGIVKYIHAGMLNKERQVVCTRCSANGPIGDDIDEAIELWGKRDE